MKKSLQKFVDTHAKHIIAVYAYTLGHEVIPLLVVQDFDSETQKKLSHISEPGRIVLTQNDLDHGDDVFCVVLLHIQCNSICERWTDVINQVTITHIHLRHHLEAQIRHVMINMRESMILWRTTWDLLPGLHLQLSRIMCGLSFLHIEHDMIDSYEHKLSCIYTYLHNRVHKVDARKPSTWKK